MKRQTEARRKLLDEILNSANIEEATVQHLPEIDNLFVELLRDELQAAQKDDQARYQKLQQIVTVLQQASAPPPEVELIETLLGAKDDKEMRQVLEENKDQVNDQFLQMFAGLIQQAEGQEQDPKAMEHIRNAYRAAVRYNMEKNLSQ